MCMEHPVEEGYQCSTELFFSLWLMVRMGDSVNNVSYRMHLQLLTKEELYLGTRNAAL